MIDTFTFTLLFILLSALIAVVISKLKKDKCLKDFQEDVVVLEKVGGQELKGSLKVFNTGMEFAIPKIIDNTLGLSMNTYLLYKSEYTTIQILVRYINDLSDKARLKREKDIEKTFHPSKIQRFFRKITNFFKTIKDSLLEIINLLGNQIGKGTAFGMVMASQDKYINKVKNDIVGTIDNSFEPLIENYIGYRVTVDLLRGEELVKYSGILKRYTSDFIELIDVDYSVSGLIKNGGNSEKDKNKNNTNKDTDISYKQEVKKADLIIPRRYGVVRGLSD